MRDPIKKTKSELIEEMSSLKQRIEELEQAASDHRRNEERLGLTLRESEERFRTFMDNSPAIAWAKDEQGRYVYLNRTCQDRFGLRPENWLGKTDFDLWPADIAESFRKNDQAVIASSQPVEAEEETRNPDGSPCTWWDFKFSFQDAVGRRYIGGIGVDITERKRIEEALRKNEERMSRAEEIAHLGSWELDIVNNRLSWSDEAYRIFGFKPQDFGATYETFLEVVHPDDRAAVDAAYSGSLKEGRDTYEIEHRIVRKSTGEVRIVREKCEHVRDASGRIVRSVGMVHDITAHKRAEEELRKAYDELELRVEERTAELHSAYNTLLENERLYRNLFENASIGMFQSRLDGSGFLRINKSYATMLGYESPEEVMSTVTDTATQIHTDPKYRDELLAALERNEWHYAEQPYFRKDGTVMTARLAVRKVRNPDGTPAYLEGIVEDITERKRAEEALRESEAFNRRLFESNRTAIVVMDAETTRYVDCNPAAVTIYRYGSREELIGKTPLDVSAEIQYDGTPSPEKAMYYIKEARDKGFVTFEWFHRRPDGRYWDALVHLMSFESRGHRFLQFSLYDITEQKKTEEALKQAEAKYRTIFENAGMGIYRMTPEGRYIAVNPALARIYGYESPEEMTETITDIGAQTYVNPEERVRLVELLKEHGVVEDFESQFYRKDKSTGWISINSRVVKDAEGNIVYFEGTIEDITERKQAKKALQESEEKYRSVVESSFVGLSIVQDRKLRFVNRGFCEITGYTYDELVDRLDPLDITHPADRKIAELAMRKGVTGEAGNVEFDCRIVRKDGRMSHVKVFGTSLLYNGRQAAAGTMIDISREKDLEHQLLRTQKLEAIGTLAGGIAHDFNNILAGIIGFTEMVQDDMPPDSREHYRLGLVLKGAHRGRDLVKQILTFSRQTGHEQKPVALSAIVEESLKLLRPLLPATIEIRSKSLTGDDTIFADSAQIHQVLMNLCTNGAQAMGKRGALEVSVSRDHFRKGSPMPSPGMKPGDYVTLTVRDTGSGMKPEVLERIFDPFFTTKTHGEGTGLGLSVVHGIVKSHGGFINVESEPGRGSVFSVYLPKLERQEALAAREELPVAGGKECILFVDDEEILVELNHERLTQLGYEVTATTSVLKALEIFKKEPLKFDLVITDYTMPDMTGVDLARKLLKIRNDIPIILCTGYNDDISSDKAKKAGIREFLLKPQDKHQLDLTIRKVLDLEIL